MGKVIQVVVYKSVSDEAKLAKYAELALPAMEGAGGRFLARSIPVAVKEAGEFTRTVVTDLSTQTGSFDAPCPFGVSITGEYTFNSGTGESSCSGRHTFRRNISFNLGPA